MPNQIPSIRMIENIIFTLFRITAEDRKKNRELDWGLKLLSGMIYTGIEQLKIGCSNIRYGQDVWREIREYVHHSEIWNVFEELINSLVKMCNEISG